LRFKRHLYKSRHTYITCRRIRRMMALHHWTASNFKLQVELPWTCSLSTLLFSISSLPTIIKSVFVKYFLNKVKQFDLSRKFSSLCNIFSLEIKLIKIRLEKERKASFMNVCYFTKPALALRKEIGSLKSMLAVFCIFSFGPNFPDSFG